MGPMKTKVLEWKCISCVKRFCLVFVNISHSATELINLGTLDGFGNDEENVHRLYNVSRAENECLASIFLSEVYH